jgi:DNA-binding GntR family transcriptional regulator
MRSADLLMATTMSTGEDRLFQDRRNAIEPLEVTEGIASLDERVRLNLLPGATVYRIRRVRRQGNQILLVEDVRLPATLFPRLRGASDIHALAKKYDLLLGDAIERISSTVASETVANALRVVVGTPVVQLDRVVHLADGQPAEWRTAYGVDPEKRSRLLSLVL